MKRSALIAVGVAATVAVTWAAVAASGQSSPTHAAAAPAALPTDTTWPLGAVPRSGPAVPSTPATTGPAPAPVHSGSAAPFVQAFANQPGVPAQAPVPSPTAALRMPPNLDGCDHDYGTVTQCVPWTFPAGVTDKCAWLAGHGFAPLPVVGTDRQNLDPDGNRIACD